jgi:hypothetical protein
MNDACSTETAGLPRIGVAVSPHKQDMLDRLDVVRAGVERGETVGLLIGEIHTDNEFTVSRVAAVSGLEGLGLLVRALFLQSKAFDE